MVKRFLADFKTQQHDRRRRAEEEEEAKSVQLAKAASMDGATSPDSPVSADVVPDSSVPDSELSAEELRLRQEAQDKLEAADEVAAGKAFSSQTMPAPAARIRRTCSCTRDP